MDRERKILRLGTAAVVCAVLIRLIVPGVEAMDQARVASFILFLQTGRVVRQVHTPELPTEETAPPIEEPISAKPLVFSPEEARNVAIADYAGLDPDVESLLLQPLSWNLENVLILHTHGSESYENTEGYLESSEYRTLQEEYNMLSIGAYMAQLLTQEGFDAIQDRQLHDYPSYNGSYANARASIQGYLQTDPAIQLILDLHRDAAVDGSGAQVGYTVDTPQGPAAKVMFVVGGGQDNWQDNLALAVKLQAVLERLCPGICRPISLRRSAFNQDLSSGAVLVEVGAAGNTRQEALVTTEYLAQAVSLLKAGSTS